MADDCLFHCCEMSEMLTPVTQTLFSTSKWYAQEWQALNKSVFSSAASKRLNIEYFENNKYLTHYSCYSRFTNKLVLERAKKRSCQEVSTNFFMMIITVCTAASC